MLNQRQVWFSFFILFFFTSTNAWSLTYLGEADKYFLLFDFFFQKTKVSNFFSCFSFIYQFFKKKKIFYFGIIFFISNFYHRLLG